MNMKTPEIEPYKMDWSPLLREAPNWFRDAKFGLFFHWGPYCVPAYQNEWYSRNMYATGLQQNVYHTVKYGPVSEFGYKDFLPMFTGEKFNPEEWAELIEKSGAKYAGPVAEHSDNYSLWNSKVNPVNSVNYGLKRDVVGELAKAIRKRNIKFITTFHHQWLWGWFMSSNPDADVYDPANKKFYGKPLPLETCRMLPWQLPDEEFNETWLKKVEEVIDGYDPDLIYFDSRTNIISENARYRLLDYYYNGPSGRKDRVLTYKLEDFPVNSGVYDVESGHFSNLKDFPWQSDDRLESRVTWCYVEQAAYRSAEEMIHTLCDIVSKNGNLLLNVGPKADGTFAKEAVDVLYSIGDWLSKNGEAIYGTRPFAVYGEGPTAVEDANFNVDQIKNQIVNGTISAKQSKRFSANDMRFTTKDDVVYAILLGNPAKKNIKITSLAAGKTTGIQDIVSIDLLCGESNLAFMRDQEALTVQLKGSCASPYANVLKITVKK
jgi:alpha-L-fucosidase